MFGVGVNLVISGSLSISTSGEAGDCIYPTNVVGSGLVVYMFTLLIFPFITMLSQFCDRGTNSSVSTLLPLSKLIKSSF